MSLQDHKVDICIPCPLFDSHFHALHMAQKGFDLHALMPKIFSEGLIGAVEVAVTERQFQQRLDLVGNFPGLWLSAGIHPSSSGDDAGVWEHRFAKICAQAEHPRVRAIGETGLDFSHQTVRCARQEKAFLAHLNLATETGLPVIVHNRDADDHVLATIRKSACRHGVFHCFSSPWATARQVLELGFYISFSGNITYRKMDEIRAVVTRIPSDRLLIETDAPYLSPQVVRGKPNHPGHIGHTLKILAEIRNEGYEDLAKATVVNSLRLFQRK